MADEKLAEMALADPKRVKRYVGPVVTLTQNAHQSM
jgi:hypothetical protein